NGVHDRLGAGVAEADPLDRTHPLADLFGNHLMELHLFTVDPGAGTGGPFHHEGEEFIMMLEGILRVSIDSLEHYVLEPGDVLYFESFHRHEWVNPGPTPAVFLGVNTPRTF
ncbi:MAG: cupin domain-containing protein, partial [Chloroflexia bacterium]|nr:cupin domain-containing protein [Chloroflexia bacterium]